MRKPKRIICIILAFVISFALLAPALTEKSSAETAYFTAVNNTLFELSDQTMPFWSGGNLYVPSTVFSSSDLGVSYAYSAAEQKAMLYRDQTALLFDIQNGGVLTQNGVSYAFSTVTKSGYVFFPMAFVCAYFSLSYSILDTDYLPMVRIKSSDNVLRDSVFINAADTYLSSRYNKYIQGKQPSSGNTQGGTAGDTASGDTGDDDTAKNSITVCMSFIVSDGETAAEILDRLDGYGLKATFFFSAASLSGKDDLLRRMTAEGHTVGLMADSALSPSDAVRTLDGANAALKTCTGATTRIAMYGGDAKILEAAGYCLWTANVDAAALGKTGSARASSTLRKIAARTSYARVLFTGDEVTAAAMTSLLPKLKADSYRVRAVNEVNC